MSLRSLWQELNRPSRFDGEPLMGLYNQWGHFTLGAAVFILICAGFFFVAGEMPPRYIAAAVVTLAYLVVIEWWVQGWNGKDSLEDTGYVAGGIWTVATSVQEVSATGWRSEIVVEVGHLAASIVFMSWACVVYAITRFRA